jgi:hypothetical protein
MRFSILLGGPALLLAACSGNNQADNAINADQGLSAESFSSNDVTAIDAVTGDASNMAADVNYVVEADNNTDGESTPGKAPPARRPAGESAASNEPAPAPAPAANSAAPATANNSL